MTAGVQAVRTPDPREAYLADHETFTAGGPDWVRVLRNEAISHFAEHGFPSPRREDWRFTGIQPLIEAAFPLVSGSARLSTSHVSRLALGVASWPRLVVVDGRYVPSLSSLAGLPGSVRAGSLAEAIERDDPAVRAHVGRHARYDANPFTALAAAFLHDGVYLVASAGAVVSEPVEILFVSTRGERPALSHSRALIVTERGARVSVLETHVAADGGRYLANAVTELVVGEGARVGYYRVQRDSIEAYHVATTHAVIARDAALSACAVALGASLARHDLVTVLDGPGADATLNGLYLLGGRQVVDHHMLVEHARPHCTSHELFNGVLDGHARSVFTGRIHVHPGAQRTDAKQVNNNLLLSRDARADSQPQLEIYADDVKCTHGSTLGPVDDVSLFYLQSRGLDRAAARNLLTYGFAADIITRVPDALVRGVLDGLITSRLQQEAARAG